MTRGGDNTTVALALALACAACAPQTGLGRATTIERGRVQVSGGLDVSLVSMNRAATDPVRLPWLDVVAGVRYGLADRVEIGGRAWAIGVRGLAMWGVAADTKIALLRSSERGAGWNAATAASIGYHQVLVGGTPLHALTLTVPLLFGIDLGRDQLFFGPRVTGQVWTGQGQGAIEAFSFGASAGYSIAFGDRFELIPEIVLMWMPISLNGERHDPDRYGAGYLHLGIGGAYDLP